MSINSTTPHERYKGSPWDFDWSHCCTSPSGPHNPTSSIGSLSLEDDIVSGPFNSEGLLMSSPTLGLRNWKVLSPGVSLADDEPEDLECDAVCRPSSAEFLLIPSKSTVPQGSKADTLMKPFLQSQSADHACDICEIHAVISSRPHENRR